ncbi:MAG: zf-HC2 domain-containing protein [Terriglobia bacterium]
MNCPEVIHHLPLYCYGEITSEAEEAVEAHLAECGACRQELQVHRSFLERLDERADMAETSLLSECRVNLRNALHAGARPPALGRLDRFWNLARLNIPFRVPVGAMALVALGFLAARYTPEKFGGTSASMSYEPMFSSVRSVEPRSSGGVDIAVDEVRRHVVSGSVQDPHIQALLLTAVREEANPGVRVESIRVLNNGADSEKVREALIYSLMHDPSSAVRLKAMEGLKTYAGDATVRRTLAGVLLKDDDASVRVQAIDMLTRHHDDSIVGVLQDVVQKEDNTYVRAQCSKLLEAMNASVGTY